MLANGTPRVAFAYVEVSMLVAKIPGSPRPQAISRAADDHAEIADELTEHVQRVVSISGAAWAGLLLRERNAQLVLAHSTPLPRALAAAIEAGAGADLF